MFLLKLRSNSLEIERIELKFPPREVQKKYQISKLGPKVLFKKKKPHNIEIHLLMMKCCSFDQFDKSL
jgi:hypothetical protein